MQGEKQKLARDIESRRREARKVLVPQWRACFWTRPFGHIRDGSTSRDVVRAGSYYEVCIYCGKPVIGGAARVKQLEEAADIAGRYPIAQGLAKSKPSAA